MIRGRYETWCGAELEIVHQTHDVAEVKNATLDPERSTCAECTLRYQKALSEHESRWSS